jgi:glycosyltransferase involved in cell wall biosynthesis
MTEPKTISIVIPVYNEERYIEQILTRVQRVEIRGYKKEIIVVNDYSSDKSMYMVENVSRKQGNIKLINNPTNRGKGYSVKTGIRESSGEIVIIQDADLEYNPEDYVLLLEPFEKNQADVVYGSRFISNRPHRVLYFWHFVGNRLLTLLSNVFTNLNLTDMETGYKAFKGSLVRDIATRLTADRFGFEPEITAKLAKVSGIKFYEVGVTYQGRTYAEGKKISWRDGIRAIWEIFYFNLLP